VARRSRPRRLNSPSSRKAFEERYGKTHGDRVWGATMEKVAAEQAADSPRRVKIERVRGHWSTSPKGRRFRVRGHPERIRASSWHRPHMHAKGEHPGACSGACRQGKVAHPGFDRRRRR
jgi:hypothetical protein